MLIGTYNKSKVEALLKEAIQIQKKYVVSADDPNYYDRNSASQLCEKRWNGRNFNFSYPLCESDMFLGHYFLHFSHFDKVVFPNISPNSPYLEIATYSLTNSSLENAQNMELSVYKVMDNVSFNKYYTKLKYSFSCPPILKNCKFSITVEGKMYFEKVLLIENVVFPKIMKKFNKLEIESSIVKDVKFPLSIGEFTILNGELYENVTFPKQVDGDFIIKNIRCIKNCIFPEKVNGNIILSGIEMNDINCHTWITELSKVSCNKLVFNDIDGMTMTYGEYISRYPSLKEIIGKDFSVNLFLTSEEISTDLFFPNNKFNGSIFIPGAESLPHIEFPEEIDGDLRLPNLKIANSVIFPEKVNGVLDLPSLTTLKGTTLPLKVGSLILNSLVDRFIYTLPENVDGSIELLGLQIVEHLQFPKKITGNVEAPNLLKAGHLVFPMTMKGNINLYNLSKVGTIIFPQELTGNINLNRLLIADVILCPKNLIGNLNLSYLNKVNTLILPDNIFGDLFLNNLSDLNGVVLPKRVTGNIYINKKLSKQVDLSGICDNVHIIEPESTKLTMISINLPFLLKKMKLNKPNVQNSEFLTLDSEFNDIITREGEEEINEIDHFYSVNKTTKMK